MGTLAYLTVNGRDVVGVLISVGIGEAGQWRAAPELVWAIANRKDGAAIPCAARESSFAALWTLVEGGVPRLPVAVNKSVLLGTLYGTYGKAAS